MNKKNIIIISSLLTALTLIVADGWLLFTGLKRDGLVDSQREAISLIKQEIAEYKQFGFDEESELMAILSKRLKQSKLKKRAIKYQWAVNVPAYDARVQLERLFGLNRNMLMSYMKDLQEYRKLGVPHSHPIIRFSYDKIVRLTIALSELERQLKDGAEQGEFANRVHRMSDITKQSIAQYKQALETCCADDAADGNDLKINFLRLQLTARVKEMDMLDSIQS